MLEELRLCSLGFKPPTVPHKGFNKLLLLKKVKKREQSENERDESERAQEKGKKRDKLISKCSDPSPESHHSSLLSALPMVTCDRTAKDP